jgi:ATP-binding protein involved in chromosome partitioning
MKTLMVYSAKGGVGKSTVACNIAFALRESGSSVGLFDADFKTPSIRRLVANVPLTRAPRLDAQRVKPAQTVDGVRIQSTAYFSDNDMLFWPDDYIEGAVWQLFNPQDWKDLDYLIIDMPPAIDTIHSYLCSVFEDAKIIYVSTYSPLSIEDYKKGAIFMQELEMDILGTVMNMVYAKCPYCGNRTQLFGHDQEEILTMDVIQTLPLSRLIVESASVGLPLVMQKNATEEKNAFLSLANSIRARL